MQWVPRETPWGCPNLGAQSRARVQGASGQVPAPPLRHLKVLGAGAGCWGLGGTRVQRGAQRQFASDFPFAAWMMGAGVGLLPTEEILNWF